MKLRKPARKPLPALQRHARAGKLRSLADYLENEWFGVVAVQHGTVVADGRLIIARRGVITGWPDVLAIVVAGVRFRPALFGSTVHLYHKGVAVDVYTSRDAASESIRKWCVDNPD